MFTLSWHKWRRHRCRNIFTLISGFTLVPRWPHPAVSNGVQSSMIASICIQSHSSWMIASHHVRLHSVCVGSLQAPGSKAPLRPTKILRKPSKSCFKFIFEGNGCLLWIWFLALKHFSWYDWYFFCNAGIQSVSPEAPHQRLTEAHEDWKFEIDFNYLTPSSCVQTHPIVSERLVCLHPTVQMGRWSPPGTTPRLTPLGWVFPLCSQK